MKVGDLVTFGKRHGIIVEDRTMWFSHDTDAAYLAGAMMVYTGGKIERIVYANMRLVNASR
tara:strand:- start:432 stop:614 length:183 start_codon:yes stop_codon:yes gene_type:complete